MPAAIAPEETSTTCRPSRARAATAATMSSSRAGSRRPREVSDELPTFTTVRCAAAISCRATRSLVRFRSRLAAARLLRGQPLMGGRAVRRGVDAQVLAPARRQVFLLVHAAAGFEVEGDPADGHRGAAL